MQAYENGHKFRITNKWATDLADAIEMVATKYYGPAVVTHPIESLLDWVALAEIVEVYDRFFPEEIKEYLRLNSAVKANQKNKFGLLEDPTTKKGGESNVRQLGTVPFHLETLIRVVWPRHRFTRKFNEKFFKTFTRFSTAERI